VNDSIHVLYVAYWGVMEPLGQALVLPQVTQFAESGTRVTLVTFEKPHHLAARADFERHRRQLRATGLHWIPLRYHQRPTVPATSFDVLHGLARAVVASLPGRPDVIHGRTYVGGIIGSIVARTLRRPSIFHNEGFWPDEQVAIGKWREAGWPYRASKRLELAMYRGADAVITLSDTAREIVSGFRPHRAPESLVVVPSCVDLERFRPMPRESDGACRLVYTGSLGGRYRIHEMARFLRAAREQIPGATATIYSHSSAEMIRSELRANGVDDSWWSLDFKPHAQMAGAVAAHHAGLFFLAPGVNARVCSPTKIGEYWAAGLPVVTTPTVGDVDALVRRERVGVIVEADTDESCRAAAGELRALLGEPDLARRCRRAAEDAYSLDRGVETQLRLYRWLTGTRPRAARLSAATVPPSQQASHAL
jgi:glycosyltransferase involved in cell wall biosynthesis